MTLQPQELLEEYEEGYDRLARIQALRGDIYEHTGIELPDGQGQIEEWLRSRRGALTRAIRGAAGEYDGEEESCPADGQGEE